MTAEERPLTPEEADKTRKLIVNINEQLTGQRLEVVGVALAEIVATYMALVGDEDRDQAFDHFIDAVDLFMPRAIKRIDKITSSEISIGRKSLKDS